MAGGGHRGDGRLHRRGGRRASLQSYGRRHVHYVTHCSKELRAANVARHSRPPRPRAPVGDDQSAWTGWQRDATRQSRREDQKGPKDPAAPRPARRAGPVHSVES
eukprot:7383252-Prymnesium_polylepis.1